jgi:hypothetical protein
MAVGKRSEASSSLPSTVVVVPIVKPWFDDLERVILLACCMAISRRRIVGAASAAATLVGTLGLVTPAMAGYNDSFSVKTPNGCGSIEFVDYGDTPWGKQDDFVIVHDLCGGGRGVRGYATSWVPGQESSVSTITCHNSNGLAGAAKYCTLPELSAGDRLLLQVELTKDGTPIAGTMGSAVHDMHDD